MGMARMLNITIDSSELNEDDISFKCDCGEDEESKSICKALYMQRVDDNIHLCEALRAVYALAGEDRQVREIVEDALNAYGV
jgi:hypothetical protein